MACIVFILGLVNTVIAGARELQDVNGKVGYFKEKSATNDVQTAIKELSRNIEKIGTRLTSLSNQMKEVGNNVSGITNRVYNLEKKMDMLHPFTTVKPTTTFVPSTARKSTTTPVQWVYYPPHTTEHRAKKFYPEYNLKFAGFGYGESELSIDEIGVSFEYCLQKCFDNRKDRGDSWNDLQYRYRFKRCFCGKNSGSHVEEENGDLHYYF